jgi:NADPH:quinone reductase-like Zn-dependent oxidoreductase
VGGKDQRGCYFVAGLDWLDGPEAKVWSATNTLGCGDTQGTLQQYAVVEDARVIREPSNLSFEEAASIGIAGGTAMNILQTIQVGKGTTVLTQSTGGVSCLTTQVSAEEATVGEYY